MMPSRFSNTAKAAVSGAIRQTPGPNMPRRTARMTAAAMAAGVLITCMPAWAQQQQVTADDVVKAIASLPPEQAARLRAMLAAPADAGAAQPAPGATQPGAQAGGAEQRQPMGGAGGQAYAPQVGRPGGGAVGGPQQPQQGAPAGHGAVGSLPPPPMPEQIYEEWARKNMPVTSGMVRTTRRRVDELQEASSAPPHPIRTGTTTVQVSFEPGRRPQEIVVAPNMATGINVLDATGEPWPIESFIVGNPAAFSVVSPTRDGNMVSITPLTQYAQSNLLIVLRGAPAFIPVTISVGNRATTQGVDLRVDALGPNANKRGTAGGSSVPLTGSRVMQAVLDGVPPPGAQPMRLVGVPGSAWRLNGELYVRTRAQLISPGYADYLLGPSGYMAFRTADVPVLMMSTDGNMRDVRVVTAGNATQATDAPVVELPAQPNRRGGSQAADEGYDIPRGRSGMSNQQGRRTPAVSGFAPGGVPGAYSQGAYSQGGMMPGAMMSPQVGGLQGAMTPEGLPRSPAAMQ